MTRAANSAMQLDDNAPLGRELTEVGLQGRVVVRLGQRLAPGDPDGHPLGGVPGDGVHQVFGYLAATTLKTYCSTTESTPRMATTTRIGAIQYAHGFVFVTNGAGVNGGLSQGYLAGVIPDVNQKARSADPLSIAAAGTGETLGN